MTIEKCLDEKVLAGRITREQAQEALNLIKEFERQGEGNAVERAAAHLKEAAERRAVQKVRQIIAQDRALQWAQTHEKGWNAGVRAVFARDPWGKAGHESVEGQYHAFRAFAYGGIAELLDRLRSKAAGLKQETLAAERFVRSLYGENPDALTKAWEQTTDWLAKSFKEAGGVLPRRETWRIPQHWSRRLVAQAGEQKFFDWMWERRNSGKLSIVDWRTGLPVNDERAAEIIRNAYKRIVSDGMSDLDPGVPKHVKLANSRIERRAFEWTSADAWLEFNDTFGVGRAHIYALITGHIDSLARDIALLRVMGPDPDSTARFLVDHALKNGVGKGKAHLLEALYEHVSGKAMSPVSEFWANTFRSVREWLTSAQLGTAMLSSVSDFATLRQTSAFNGLEATKVIARYASLLNPANPEHRHAAARTGLVAESWVRRAAGATRDQAEIVGPELAGRVAEFVMRASGLSPHTDAGKMAFGMEYLAYLADHSGKKLASLPEPTQKAFARHGITEADWDSIRSGAKFSQDGVKFLWPEKLAKEGNLDAAIKLMDLVDTEMDFAIPSPGAFDRSLLLGKTKPGTLAGELLRATAQYKTFPVTVITHHLMRGLSEIQGGDYGRYMASISIGMTVMGALAVQMKAIAQGKDPRDMTDPKFWGAAFVQGGGAGILGDFLYAPLARHDQSLGQSLLGPTVGLADDLYRLTLGNFAQEIEGKESNFAAEAVRFARRNTPGTTLWYSKLATDRLLFDQLQMALDPQYAQRFARMESRARREYGQEFWWRPGDLEPSRGPALP